MTEKRSPGERQQHREDTLVGRDRASSDTVMFMNHLRNQIDDPAAAKMCAMLHAQMNGDHPAYTSPPEREPFGHWHSELALSPPNVTATTADSATVEVSLSALEFVDDADVKVRFTEQTPSTDTRPIDTPTKTLTSTTVTEEFTTDGLVPDTEYMVAAIAEAETDSVPLTDYSDQIYLTTDQQ